jgi:hypothetical protein
VPPPENIAGTEVGIRRRCDAAIAELFAANWRRSTTRRLQVWMTTL